MSRDINAKTELYAVIGDPISHSLSPRIHNKVFEELQLDRVYIALRVPTTELGGALSLLKHNFKGFNVTIPHKEAIIPFLDEIDPSAKLYGAVNTVKVEEGILKGYNTDGFGFIQSMERIEVEIEGKPVLVLGSGGAARVIAFELLQKGCSVTIANRGLDKGKKLRDELLTSLPNSKISIITPSELTNDYFCIVNTTPVGMAPLEGESPIEDKEVLKSAVLVYDLIYNPYRTKLLREAEVQGCKVLNGLSMLFHQAVKAQEIWLNTKLNENTIKEAYSQLLKKDIY